MAGEGMNVRGPCSSCGAQLASDQRYCVECGQRVGPPLAMPYAVRMPVADGAIVGGGRMLRLPMSPEMAGLFAAIALGFGVVLGTAISPGLAGLVAAPAPPVVAQAPPVTPATPAGGGRGAPAPAPAATPATTVASTAPTESSGGGDGGGGGDGHDKKEKQRPEPPIVFSGTVLRVNPIAQSYAVSTGTGLVAIHAATLPQVGDQVESTVRKLSNGTFAESKGRNPTGHADVASFEGTVTYCADLEQPSAPCDGNHPTDHYVYAVSSLGASVLVSWRHSATDPPPAVGSRIQVEVQIGPAFQPISPLDPAEWTPYDTCNPAGSEETGAPAQTNTVAELTQTSVTQVAGPVTNATLEAVVQTVCPSGLVLSADDIRESGRDLDALPIPSGIDSARLSRGQAVQVDLEVSGGTMTLKGITSDQGEAGADDAGQGQGTLTGS